MVSPILAQRTTASTPCPPSLSRARTGDDMNFTHDLFETLVIPATDDIKAIRRQYRLLARLYHLDVNASTEAYTRFHEMQFAYDLLSDGARREAFSRWHPSPDAPRRPVGIRVILSPAVLSR